MAPSDLQLYSRAVLPEQISLARAVRDMALSTNEPQRALGLNLICEHRISPARADHFFKFLTSQTGPTITPQNVVAGLKEYRKVFIAIQPGKTYDEGFSPSINYVDDAGDLVNACNVSSKLIWATRYSAKSSSIRAALKRMQFGSRALTNTADVYSAIRSKTTSELGRATFVHGFLELMNVYRFCFPWNPIWAADWLQFQSAAKSDLPGYWLESVGIPCPEESEWIMLFRYSASEVSSLYRPTQLEAGDFPYHFPSPPTAPCSIGGHPMSMEHGPAIPETLLSEYIHSEIAFSFKHWENAGSKLAPTPSVAKYDRLMSYRRRHHALLEETYNPQIIEKWMPDATRLDK